MEEVMVNIKKYDLCNKLGVDMISASALIDELDNALCEIEILKEKIEDLQSPEEDDVDYDWMDIQDHKPSWWNE